MMMPMKLLRRRGAFLENLEYRLGQSIARLPDASLPGGRGSTERIALAAAWIAGGIGVVALGLLAGRELRVRYKMKRRTPYDYYAHSGDRTPDLEFGVGI